MLLWCLETALPDGDLIRVNGTVRQKADVLAELQAVLMQYAAVDDAAAIAQANRARLRDALPAARLLLAHLKDAMIGVVGRDSPELGKFGLEARAVRKLTVKQKALAAEKARRTRVLRGTKGSRQKAAIRYVGEPTLVLGHELVDLPRIPSPRFARWRGGIAPATPTATATHRPRPRPRPGFSFTRAKRWGREGNERSILGGWHPERSEDLTMHARVA